MTQEQSTAKFLFSREGRGILIGVIVLVAIVGMVGTFAYNSLFGSDDPRTNRRNTGEETVKAGNTDIQASTAEIRPNLTSENLNQESRNLLDDYNDQAGSNNVMPVPTPDNVSLVPINPSATGIDGAENQQGNNIDSQYANDAARQERLRAREAARARELAAEQARQELQQRRIESASQVLAIYAAPPVNASFSVNAAGTGNSGIEGPNQLARVSRSEDGTTQFVKGSDASVSQGQCKTPLIKGGEFRYAQSDIALNTDFQGPVRVTFLDGDIAGFTGMGKFELNEFGAKMKLTINTLFDTDGQRYGVSGYVLDPETTLWAMSSDVDRHIIYRYGGFGLGTVLSAFAILADNRATESEITTPEGGQSTVYRDPDGKQVAWTIIGEFSRLFETAFRDNLNRPITVTLDPLEEIAVLFEDTVCELDTKITRDRKASLARIQSGFSDPVSQ